MPVLVNNDSGLAENLDEQAALRATQAGTHGVPLVDHEGNTVVAPYDEAAGLVNNGHSQPSAQQLHDMVIHGKTSGLEGQIVSGLEGAGSALSMGATTASEVAGGEDPAMIRARAENNPIAHGIGELAGLGVGMMGGGIGADAKLMDLAGGKAAEHAGQIFGQGALGKIGTAATKMAAENMVFQAGSEADKMFVHDPDQSVETAIANMGIAGAFGAITGGAFKGSGELWDMTAGKQVSEILNTIKNKASGVPDAVKTSADLSLAPEIEAALGDNDAARRTASLLMESNSKAGTAFQDSMATFKQDANNAVASTLQRTPEELSSLKDISKYDLGKEAQDVMAKSINEKVAPIASKFEELTNKFKSAEIAPETRLDMSNKISQYITDSGLLKGQNESALKIAQDVFSNLDKQSTAQDLRTYVQNIKAKYPFGSENYQVGKSIANILEGGQEAVIEHAAGQTPLFAEFKATQAEYGKFKGLLEELNDRLHLGKEAKYGPASFVRNLKDMDPETVVNRLKLKDDVGLQNLLQEHFPEINDLAKKQELDMILKKSLHKDGDMLDMKKLFKNLDAQSPELRKALISEPALARLDSIRNLVNRIPEKMNSSGTAKTLDKMWSGSMGNALGMVTALLSHAPGIGYIVGQLAHSIGKEAPDAVRMAMLKFAGSDLPVSARGFAEAVKQAAQTIKGEKMVTKATEAVFTGAHMPISEPAPEVIDKIKKMVDQMSEDPGSLLNGDDHASHYLPEHSAAMAGTTVRTLGYLATLKPNTMPAAPFDMKLVASKQDEHRYDNAIAIAQQPLLVLKRIQDGTFTQEDSHHLHTMYPALTTRLQAKLQDQIIDAAHNEENIPYHVKLNTSLFIGQPLDSSMKPSAIMANQPQQQQAAQPPGKPIRASSDLKKIPKTYMTPEQSREASRNTGD